MEIQYGALQSPKPGSTAAQCEDAFAYSDSSTMSIAAVCDGAGTAFESRLWASLLADAFVTAPPPEWTGAAVLDWADTVARYWRKEIPWQRLNPFEEEKARQGSAATLVGMQFAVPPPHATTGTWQCLALGDSCLFQMRQGQPVAALPLQRSADFNAHPPLLSTQRSITEQYIGKLVTYEGIWQTGDTFLLMTDAIAAWFLREGEQGTEPWDFLAALDERRFAQFVHETQTRRLMRTDDVTVFMIGMGAPLSTRQVPAPVQPEPVLAGQRQRDPGLGDLEPRTARQGWSPQSEQPPPDDQMPDTGRQGGGRKFIRSRAALIAAACVVLAAVVAIVLASTGGGPPPSSASAKTAGTQFAKALATYPYQGKPAKPGETPYAAYVSALRRSVAGQNAAVVYRLVGHRLAPAAPLRSQATVGSVTAAQSSQSRAILYIVVHQVITAPHAVSATTRRTLLVYLVMTRRPGQDWLVKNGQTSLIAPVAQGGGVLSPVTSPFRPHPPAPPPPAVKKSVTVTGGNQ